jgi:hypothetical protein
MGEWHPLSAGIYDPIFVKSLPFMLKKAQIMQFFSIKKNLMLGLRQVKRNINAESYSETARKSSAVQRERD